ncbi:MAG: gliding motility-associated C-terminal domain-containing protein [Saprospiraceae bacterium]|nr:gliding motility-associated C-terminal domain-containing protein [Candidatus Opimibacter skivensis]
MNYLLPLRLVFLLFLIKAHSPLLAQNLIPNPGFESLTTCPSGPGTWGPTPAAPWFGPTLGTPDIFNSCANLGQSGVPDNFVGNQTAHGDGGYAGVYVRGPGTVYREYLQAPLLQPLVAGSLYSVSFYVSQAEFGCASENIGIYFSSDDPNEFGTGVLQVTPQVTADIGFLNDKENWTLISGCFTADGGEQYVTLGNFASDLQTPLEQPCTNLWSYYYIDDVSLVEITEDDAIVFDLGGPASSCSTYEIDPGLTGYFYNWEDGSHAETLTVTASGTYSLTISDGCRTGVDSIQVIIEDLSAIDLGPDVVLCTGETITLATNPTNGDYAWQDNSVADTLLVTAPGTYMLTITDQCGSVADTVVVDYTNPVAPLDFGADISLCSGQQVFLHANNFGADFLWQDNSTAESFLVTTTGSYYLQISNECSSVSDTIVVSIIDAPQVILPHQLNLCVGETLTLDAAIPDATYRWSDNSQDQQIHVTSPGTYSVTVTNTCGSDADTTIVLNGGMLPTIALGADIQLCTGESHLLAPAFSGVDSWLWSDGSSASTYNVIAPGEVHVAVSNLCGTVFDTIQVTLQAAIQPLDLGPDVEGCVGETITIESGIVDANYIWQDGSTNPDFTTTESGIYILEINNHCGSASDTIAVNLSGTVPTPALPADTTLCEGNSLILTSNAAAETSIEWQDGSASSTFVVNTPGTYVLTESNLCGDAADTIVVDYLHAPDPFSLGPDTTLCHGEILLLSSPSIFDDVLWQDGSGMLHMIADRPGTYSLMLSNDCGVVFDEIVIDYDTDIPQLNLDASMPWCAGEVITLDATQNFVAEYLWSTGSNAPSIEISSPGLYTIELAVLCKTISQVVEVYPDLNCSEALGDNIYIPNIFSPDANGVNDIFSIGFGSDLQVISLEGSIFDRWGNLVFASNQIPFQWDGFFASEEALPGVYVYLIKYKYLDGSVEKEEVLSGDVTVVR